MHFSTFLYFWPDCRRAQISLALADWLPAHGVTQEFFRLFMLNCKFQHLLKSHQKVFGFIRSSEVLIIESERALEELNRAF